MTLSRPLPFLTALAMAFAIPGNAELNPGTSAPLWSLDLGFVVHGALVQGDDLLFATVEDDTLSVRVGNLERGRLSFPIGRDPFTTVTLSELGIASPVSLFPLGDGWAVHEAPNRLTLLDSDLSRVRESGQPLGVVLPPLGTIDRVMESDGVLYVTGAGEETTLLAASLAALLGGVRNGWTSHGLGQCPEAGMVRTHAGIRIVGGDHADDSLGVSRSRTVTLDSDGLPAGSEVDFLPLHRTLGAATAAQMNNMIGVLPGIAPTRDGEPVVGQTLVFANDRASGGIARWQEAEKTFPRLANPLLLADPVSHQFYILGGTDPATGEPNTLIHSIAMMPTDALMSSAREIQRAQQLQVRAIDRLTHDEGLAKALEEDRFHVIFLYDDSEAGRDFMQAIRTNRHIRVMLQETVVSRPEGDLQLEEIRNRAQVQSLPAMVLMDQIGNVLGRYEGVPGREDVYNLLRPTFTAAGF